MPSALLHCLPNEAPTLLLQVDGPLEPGNVFKDSPLSKESTDGLVYTLNKCYVQTLGIYQGTRETAFCLPYSDDTEHEHI